MNDDFVTLVGAWSVVEIDGVQTLETARIDVVFTAAGRISGSGGVNRIIGSYTRAGAVLTLGPIASTMMAGPPEAMAQETRFLQAFQDSLNIARADGVLLLTSATHAICLAPNPLAAQPPLPSS